METIRTGRILPLGEDSLTTFFVAFLCPYLIDFSSIETNGSGRFPGSEAGHARNLQGSPNGRMRPDRGLCARSCL